MTDYSRTKIYCIRSHQTDDIYIGSSCQKTLAVRLGGHKRDYKNWLNGKHNYVTSFEIIKYGDAYIELLEEYPCRNKLQLNRKEGEYIRKMDCVNKLVAGRTIAEYQQENRERITEYKKEYYQDNKERLLEKRKQYYQDNKEKISERDKQYYQDNREKKQQKNKQYYQDNKNKMQQKNKQYQQNNKERIKQYYQDNKERITEQNKKKIKCECGSVVSKGNLPKHKKTKKHIDIMNKEKIQNQKNK